MLSCFCDVRSPLEQRFGWLARGGCVVSVRNATVVQRNNNTTSFEADSDVQNSNGTTSFRLLSLPTIDAHCSSFEETVKAEIDLRAMTTVCKHDAMASSSVRLHLLPPPAAFKYALFIHASTQSVVIFFRLELLFVAGLSCRSHCTLCCCRSSVAEVGDLRLLRWSRSDLVELLFILGCVVRSEATSCESSVRAHDFSSVPCHGCEGERAVTSVRPISTVAVKGSR